LHGRTNGDTASQIVWLFGHPVSHSLSPTMQNAAFRRVGLPYEYVARDVEPSALAEAVEGLRSPGVKGANVTVPHKEAVLPLLDEMGEHAATVGAVNTVVNENGRLKGHNTDVDGFLRSLATVLPGGASGRRFLVLGAGGVARAVLAVLQRE
jgi:shikimate dehydrogenase